MKKRYLVLLLTLLVLPLSVFATEKPKVLTLTATVDEEDKDLVDFSGTTEQGALAVTCIMYNSNNKEADRLSVSVNNQEFSGRFMHVPDGTYTLSCANYEGGEIKSAEFTIDTGTTPEDPPEDPPVEPPTPEVYTITFNSNGGTEVSPADVTSGQTVAIPNPAPTNGNKILVGWFTDNNTFQNEFDFNTPITGSFELFAKWEDPQTFTVSFDTRCEEHIDDAIVEDGQTVAKPNPDPENGDKIFGGWFEDDTFSKEYDFDTPVTSSFTLVALWNDPIVVEKKYNVEDASGNKVEFVNGEGHTYSLSIVDYLSVSKEDVMAAAGIDADQYEQIFGTIKNAVKDKGTLLSILDITITDEDDHDVTDKEVIVKIKLTEEMKKFNTLQLIYIKDDFTLENPITLKVEGDYAVGKLKHLSTYTVVGSNTTSNPRTNDNINIWYTLFIISLIGLSTGIIYMTRLQPAKIKK